MPAGCNAPKIPQEVQLAESQRLDLLSSGAEAYSPGEFSAYQKALLGGLEHLARENEKFRLFRNYDNIKNEFSSILQQGEEVRRAVEQQKEQRSNTALMQYAALESRIVALKALTHKINEGRLARKDLIKAEVILSEAGSFIKQNEHPAAQERFNAADLLIKSAEDRILPIFNRYADRELIHKWRKWVDETIADSRNSDASAIIIIKSERQLTLYKKGAPVKTYPVGLGRNGSNDKLHAGDNATPEGKYRIIKKLPRSQYHKALLINYPNEEDKRQFKKNKEMGIVPGKTGIGGLIEIHGGGKDSMTYGCIGMDNAMIDQLYSLVEIGTPVTIVGAVNQKNRLSTAIEGL